MVRLSRITLQLLLTLKRQSARDHRSIDGILTFGTAVQNVAVHLWRYRVIDSKKGKELPHWHKYRTTSGIGTCLKFFVINLALSPDN